jgi:hypothetical protein
MCPLCIATAAVMAAGAGSTAGILAVCLGKFRRLFGVDRTDLFQKERKIRWQQARTETKNMQRRLS